MVATVAVEDVPVTWDVRSTTLWSLNVPLAVKATAVPTATFGLAGVTAIDTMVALVTLSVAVPNRLRTTAIVGVAPAATPVATPCCPTELLMVATDDCPEAQVTLLVRFWVLESAKVPVAVNAVDTPSGTLAVTDRKSTRLNSSHL